MATAGRLCVIKKAGTAIAGLRVNSITWNGAGIDVTDKGDGAFQTFLTDVLATDTLEISGEGIEDGNVLRNLALSTDPADKFMTDLTYEFAADADAADTISGSFILTSYSEGSPYQEANTFTATFVRNGAHTFTAGA
mgnify:CR=1 FL=1